MKISVVIPAHNEETHIGACLDSVAAAAKNTSCEVETVVALNRCSDRTGEIARAKGALTVEVGGKCIARVRNAGARMASGDIIATIDADSRMSPNMLFEIERMLASGRHIGGGVRIWPERLSLGIVCSVIVILLPILLFARLAGGLYWCFKRDFDAIGGFDESLTVAEDLDFAERLKRHGRGQGKKFSTIRKAHIITSTRKFDEFGDWFIFRRPRFAWGVLRQKREATDKYFYEFKNRGGGSKGRF